MSSGYFMYHQVKQYEMLYWTHKVYLWSLWLSEQVCISLCRMALAEWFLNWDGVCSLCSTSCVINIFISESALYFGLPNAGLYHSYS
jgi:hypothetical protein